MNTNDYELWQRDPEGMRKRMHRRMMIENLAWVALLVALVVFVCLAMKWAGSHEVRERASYNEGFYGVSREVALSMAERGIGKSASVVLAPREHKSINRLIEYSNNRISEVR